MSYTITVSWVQEGQTDLRVDDDLLERAEAMGVDPEDAQAVYEWFKREFPFEWEDLAEDWAHSTERSAPSVTGEQIVED